MKKRLDNIMDNRGRRSGRKFISIFLLIILSLTLFVGCDDNMNIDNLLTKLEEVEEENNSYHLKSKIRKLNKENLMEEVDLEEWYRYDVDEGFDRKTITTSKEESTTTITKEDGYLIMSDSTDKVERYDRDKEDTSQLPNEGYLMNNKQLLVEDLTDKSKNHTIELVGEEKLLDRKTMHIKLVPDGRRGKTDSEELWIDKDMGIIIKKIEKHSDMTTEYEIIDLKIVEEIDDKIFEYPNKEVGK